jgi:membrane protease YdiL (CAAX protease family)
MLLKNILVFEDWAERAHRAMLFNRWLWYTVLFTIVSSLGLTWLVQQIPARPSEADVFAHGAISALYLLTGVMMIAQFKTRRNFWLLLFFLSVLVGISISNFLAREWSAGHLPGEWAAIGLLGIAGGWIVPGWSILAWLFWQNRRDLTRRLGWRWWIQRILLGIASGAAVMTILTLAEAFSGVKYVRPLPAFPQFLQALAFVLGLQAIGEELFFRGVIFQRLYHQRGQGLKHAVGLTLLFNLPLYLLHLPYTPLPEITTLALLGPFLLIIVSCMLYRWEGSLVAPIVSNALIHLYLLLNGLV